jgi:phosphomannomutase
MSLTPYEDAPGQGPGPSLPPVKPEAQIGARAIRAYDIRGLVGADIDAAGARALGLSYAAYARARGFRRFVVGRDGRLSSPALERALIDGLAAGGAEVARIGLGPTARVAFAVRELGFDGGVMVTASHHPAAENGFKLLLGGARLHGQALCELIATPGEPRRGGRVRDILIEAAYVVRLAATAEGARPLRIAWDPGHGATADTVRRLTRRIPGGHILINAEVDGRFPSHHPDPSAAKNLKALRQTVLDTKADLGLAFDGDGDRLGVVDAEGETLWPDQYLLYLAREVLARRPGAAIVADVKCSRTLFEGVRRLGGRPIVAPSGYARVREVMLANGAPLAGELSGHIFYDDWDGADDALYAAMRLIRAMSQGAGSLAEFRRSLPQTCATPELRISCPDRARAEIVAAIARDTLCEGLDADLVDGVRVATDSGWWLLRAAGSEPMLTIRCEASDAVGLEALKRDLGERLAKRGVKIDGLQSASGPPGQTGGRPKDRRRASRSAASSTSQDLARPAPSSLKH